MGLNDIKVVETTTVELIHPITGEPLINESDGTPMTITVHGPYSARYKQLVHAQQNRRLQQAQRSNGKTTLTAEDLETAALEMLVKCTADWNLTLDTKKEPFSEDAAKRVYESWPFIRARVEEVFGDERAFLA